MADTRNNVVRKITTAGIISTVAGNGTAGYTGDGGPAAAAELRNPAGVTLDTAGNLFIADARNAVIREVNTSGVISTIAGNGTAGYSGDMGPATAAQLNLPMGLSMTATGNLFIADARNNVVRKLNSSGVISTFAGNGMIGYFGDGGLATASNIYGPNDVKADALGNVYITDSNRVVRVVNSGDTIRTFAGTGVFGYSGDGGAATAAKMSYPEGLAIDAAHNIYISTSGNVIRRVGAALPGINIISNTGSDTNCIGHVSMFTATAIDYATPHYQWIKNGISVGTDAGTYTPASLATGDIVACYLLNAPAGTPLALSNNLHMDSLGRTGTISGPNHFCLGSMDNERDLGGPPAGVGNWVSSNTAVATINPGGVVTPVSLGTATIYFIVSNICGSDSASYNITIGPNTIAPISGPSVVCEGQTVTYTDATTGGRWRTRNGPFGTIDSLTGVFTAGHILGRDYILYGTSRSCYQVDSIMIDSLPVIGPIAGPSVVDSSWTITLTDPVAGGVWSSSDSTKATVDPATGIVTGVGTGTVTITYALSVPGGCTADTTYQVTIAAGTGVHAVNINQAIQVYPNPSAGALHIQWAGAACPDAALSITDMAGRMVYHQVIDMNAAAGRKTVDLSALESGMYLLTIRSANGIFNSKLTKE